MLSHQGGGGGVGALIKKWMFRFAVVIDALEKTGNRIAAGKRARLSRRGH